MAKTEKATKEPVEVARDYFECAGNCDVEGMVALWRIGGTGYIHGIAELKPPEDYRRWFGAFFAAFPDLRFEVLEITAEGEKAAVRWSAAGTFTGPVRFEGMVANGRPVELEGIDLLTIRDGLIDELHAYTNGVSLLRQLGALPDADSAQERAMMGALNLRTRFASALRSR